MGDCALTGFEWHVIQPLLPNKPRGVPRVDDRRVLNEILWVLQTEAPWRALPADFGRRTTCCDRFVRWRKAGVLDRIMDPVTEAYDGDWLRRGIEATGRQTPAGSPAEHLRAGIVGRVGL